MKQTFWKKRGGPVRPLPSKNTLDRRLDHYRHTIALPAIEIETAAALKLHEFIAIKERVLGSNLALYRCVKPEETTAADVLELCHQVGLKRLDRGSATNVAGLTQLKVTQSSLKRYVPYTSRELNWHTDGYYNPVHRRIRGMLLHCVVAAAAGGTNEFLDHEIVYTLLHHADPAYPIALCRHDAMTIPANRDAVNGYREARSGPVFWRSSGQLNMRYTSRRQHIIWRDDPLTREAVAALGEILSERSDLILRRRLKPGEGVLCNNVLHRRDAFENALLESGNRLFYRGRFHDSLISQPASALAPELNEIMLQNPLESTDPDRFLPLLGNVVDVLVPNDRGIDRKLIQVSLPH